MAVVAIHGARIVEAAGVGRVGEVGRGHDGDAVVVAVDAVAGDAGERVLRGVGGDEVAEVVGGLEASAEVVVGEVEGSCAGVGLVGGAVAVGVRRGGVGVRAWRVGGVLDAEADEAGADAGGEVFDEVGDAEAEVDVVDDAGAEGGDGVVEEAEGDGDFVFFGAEGEGLGCVLMWRD